MIFFTEANTRYGGHIRRTGWHFVFASVKKIMIKVNSTVPLGRLAAGLLDISPHDQHQPVPIKPTLRSRLKEVNSHSRPERTEQLRQTLP
jgi:hypothetical protein